ncbi:MAG: citrate transporter [Gammaproteobacteria bacterium]|nr:citrate transporter [Gammaproteobacteria bacterium]
MLALLGLVTIAALLLSILRKWLSPLVALIAIPVLAAVAGGFIFDIGPFIVDGIEAVAPMTAMFVFAIVFFGLMADAGLFKPVVSAILTAVGRRPPRIVAGTAVLAALLHLDGSGATTFLIAVPALLPIYDELKLDRRILACTVAMAAGVSNMLPWGGPTIRAATALNMNVMDVYGPLLRIHLAGLLFVVLVGYWLGLREAKRLGIIDHACASTPAAPAVKSDWRFLANAALTFGVIAALISGAIHPAAGFMIGVVVALLINFPGSERQRTHVEAHANAAFMMASILFAAGAFTGILKGSGMLDAMAMTGAGMVPAGLARQLPVLTAIASMPLSLLFDPDSFYFGVLPVIANVAEAAGATQLQVAHGALLGQMTTGFPVSPLTPATFLLVGLTGVDLAEHQRYTIPWLFATSIFMTVCATLAGLLVNQV